MSKVVVAFNQNGILTDNSGEFPESEVKIRVELGNGFLCFYAEGYGEKNAVPGYGAPVVIELYEGRLRVIVSPDINAEEPTIIDLEGAREDNRLYEGGTKA